MNSDTIIRLLFLFISFILGLLVKKKYYINRLENITEKFNNADQKTNLILSNINSCLLCIDKSLNILWSHNFHFLDYDANSDQLSYKNGDLFCKNPNKSCELCRNGCIVRKVLNSRNPQKDLIVLSSGDCYDVYANPIFDDYGDVAEVILKADNITSYHKLFTELNKKEQESESKEYLYTSVLDFMPGVFTVKSVENGLTYVKTNKTFLDMFQVRLSDVYNKNDFEIFPEDIATIMRDIDNQILESGKNITHTYPIVKHKDVYWNIYRRLVSTSKGESFIISVGHDVTSIQLATNELERAKQKAVESDKLKSLFLANMSHEIRTPLNAIIGFSELLQQTDKKSDKERYVKLINYNNELLLRQIDDILIFAQLESGMFTLKREKFDLCEFFVSCFEELSRYNNNPDVRLSLKNPFRSCEVMLDRHCVFLIISNFTINAIKNTRQGSIDIGYELYGDGIRFYVNDTGIGIPEDKHEKIFNRFEKLDEFAEGTGLGLAICKSIIAASNGKIGFESKPGIGSTFWAWVKCQPVIEHIK